MVVLRSYEQVHVLEYSSSKAIFRKHTSNSMFQNSFRESFHFFCRGRNPLTSRIHGWYTVKALTPRPMTVAREMEQPRQTSQARWSFSWLRFTKTPPFIGIL